MVFLWYKKQVLSQKNLSVKTAYSSFGLSLADGRRLVLAAADDQARRVVEFWAEKDRLGRPVEEKNTIRLLAVTGDLGYPAANALPRLSLPPAVSVKPGDLLCLLEPQGTPKHLRRADLANPGRFGRALVPRPLTEDEWFWRQLARISATIGRFAQDGGGALIHSGLAEYLPVDP